MISIPTEFRYLVACFHQDSLEGVVDEEQWIGAAAEFLSTPQKQAVRKFLDHALAGDVSNAELMRVWESSDPDFIFPDAAELRQFLTLIRGNLNM